MVISSSISVVKSKIAINLATISLSTPPFNPAYLIIRLISLFSILNAFLLTPAILMLFKSISIVSNTSVNCFSPVITPSSKDVNDSLAFNSSILADIISSGITGITPLVWVTF